MSLVIDDAHIGAVKSYFMEQCEALNEIKNHYVRAMRSLVTEGIIEGETAEAVKEFLEQLECETCDNASTPWVMSAQVERFCDNFISKVNIADKQLY